MFKPNTMLPIVYDYKQNKVYMINITTKKFYFHPKQFKPTSTLSAVIIGGGFSRVTRLWRPQLYLNDPSQVFKISLIIIVIVIGALLLGLLVKKRYQPQFKEYLENEPDSKVVENKVEIKRIRDSAQLQSLIIIFISISFLIWSVFIFNQFLDDGNLRTYIFAAILFLVFSFMSSRMDHSVFILKLTTTMNHNNQSPWWLFKK